MGDLRPPHADLKERGFALPAVARGPWASAAFRPTQGIIVPGITRGLLGVTMGPLRGKVPLAWPSVPAHMGIRPGHSE